MFCRGNVNNQINHLHARSLRTIYTDYQSSLQELLEFDNKISTDHRNICLLAIELFIAKSGLSNQIMSELLDF